MKFPFKSYQTALLFCFFGSIYASIAQNVTLDSLTGNIPEILISDSKARQALRMREIEGVGIFASKKSEVILLENLDANIALNTTRQIFSKVPGIMIWENDGSGIQPNLASRGLSPNRSWEFNVRQNGSDIASDVFGYPETYYAPPMEAVERVQVVRGAASLQYGPQFGGMVNYVLKKGASDRKAVFETRQTIGSYGVFNTYNAIGGTVGKFNYYAFGNFRRADGWRTNGDYRFGSGYLNLQYAATSKISLGLEVTHFDYVLHQPGGLTDAQWKADPRQSIRDRNWFSAPFSVGALNFDWKPTDKTKINVRAFGLLGQRNSIGFVQAITVADTINAATGEKNARQLDRYFFQNIGLEARLLHAYQAFGNKHDLAAGVRLYNSDQTRKQRGKGDTGSDYNTGLRDHQYPFEMEYNTQNAAAFVENVFRFGKIAVIPGIRYEYIFSDAAGRLNVGADGSPVTAPLVGRTRNLLLGGIGVEYHVWNHNEIYANVSSAYRPTLYSDLTPPAVTDDIDPNLKDANGYNFDLGFRGEYNDWLHWDVSAFWLQYNNRIGTLTQLRTDGTTRYQFRTNVGNSTSKGIEFYGEIDPIKALFGKTKVGNLNLFASLSWIDARYADFTTTSVSNGVITTSNLKDKKVEYAPSYIHRGGLTYAKKGFSTTFTCNAVAEVFTDASNTVDATANGQAGLLPSYQVFDWSANYHFAKYFTLGAGINNLTDARYATRRAGGYPGPGLIPADGRTWYVSVGATF